MHADEAPEILAEIRVLTRRVANELQTMADRLRQSRSKGDAVDVVTQADAHAEAMLTTALHARFPTHRINAEEGTRLGPSDSPWTWHIDPLDGTANYSRALPFWAVSVGLAWHDTPVLGAIVGPDAGIDVGGYCLSDIRAAWSHDRPLDALTAPGDPKTWLIATDWPWPLAERQRTNRFLDHLATRVRQYKTFGSAACDLAHLALGKVDAYAISAIHPWDQCAGCAITAALGAEFRRFDGTPWDLRFGDLCASRPGMWPMLQPGLR
jgi:myo-inositol-1(or 4)-monophosphatase